MAVAGMEGLDTYNGWKGANRCLWVPAILTAAGMEGLDTYNGWKGANRCPPSWLWLGWRAQILTMVGKGRIGARHLGCGWGGGLRY